VRTRSEAATARRLSESGLDDSKVARALSLPRETVRDWRRRPILLLPWQSSTVRDHPDMLLRGLIHADGCRVENRVGGRTYPRYFFSNRSADILAVFCTACDQLGLAWTRPNAKHVSIARRSDVLRLDEFVGPKS
jgi:hypothetical protein